jgi:penicillin-binding protein 1C
LLQIRRAGLGALGATVASALALVVWAHGVELPQGALDPRRVAAVRVLARNGALLRNSLSREDGGAVFVPLERISPHVIAATLASEDHRFYRHRGVDGLALLRASVQNLRALRVVSGGSTVTMQLARILRPAPRTLGAKLREAVLAYKLEQVLSKREILWLYLNRAPYGNGTFGIEAAAQRYLDKPAERLSLAEAALLSALPRSPTGYNPYRNRERLLRRQRAILAQLTARGLVSAEAERLARKEPIAWERARRPFLAPHLVERVLARKELARAVSITTTLDLELQERVETALRSWVERLRPKGVTNAAALVVENASGEVLAYVGSADYWSEKDGGQNDGTLALRQPGSAVKPLTYALALERGKTPASILRDLPVHFSTDKGDYAPRNYDDLFHGPVRLRQALACSYNVPAVNVADFLGLDAVLKRFREAGLVSLDRPARHYGLGLTLGNGEVTLQELTTAFATLARGGQHLPLRIWREARTATGEQQAPPTAAPRRVVEARAAYLVAHILSDPLARRPAFGKRSALEVGFAAAVKTGTSKDFRDNWTVGFTPQVTVGIWVGNFDGSSMHNISGVTGAAPIWNEVLSAATRGRSEASFLRPSGIVERRVCPLSGELAGPHCEASLEELFLEEDPPRELCRWHRELAIDRRNGGRAGPGCAEAEVERRVVTVYPPSYRAWALGQGLPPPPLEPSPLCPGAPPLDSTAGSARAPREPIRIRFPVEGDRYFVDPDLRRPYQRIPLEATVQGFVREVRWLVDGREHARAGYPYSASWPISPGRHTIVAVLPDGTRSRPVTVSVE